MNRRSCAPGRAAGLLLLAGMSGACGPSFDPPDVPRPDLSIVTESSLRTAVTSAQANVEANPRSAATWGRLGHVYLVHNWDAEASQCYSAAAELEPDEFRWLYLLGKSHSTTDSVAAATAFERALRLEVRYAPLSLGYAQVLRRLGRDSEAREALERAAELDPHSAIVCLARAQLALTAGEPEAARSLFDRTLALQSGVSEAHQGLAQIALARGDTEAAERHTELAKAPSQLAPMDDPLWSEVVLAGATRFWYAKRAEFYSKNKDYGSAIVEYERAAIEDEPNPMFWYNYGNALNGAGRRAEAVAIYEKAIAAASRLEGGPLPPEKHAKIRTNLGLAHAQMGDFEQAEKHWLDAIAIDRTSVEPIQNLAILWHRLGRVSEAVSLLEATPDVQQVPQLKDLLDELRKPR